MKTIIAGTRTFTHYPTAEKIIQQVIKQFGHKITEVVCGESRGVDKLGKVWAIKNKLPVKSFPAAWEANGKTAGMVRNLEMASYAEALIALWDGKSPGTANMLKVASQQQLLIFLILLKASGDPVTSIMYSAKAGAITGVKPLEWANPKEEVTYVKY